MVSVSPDRYDNGQLSSWSRPLTSKKNSSIASDWPWQNMPVPKAEVATKPESKKRSSGNISTVKKRLNSVLGQQPIEPPRTLKGRHDVCVLLALLLIYLFESRSSCKRSVQTRIQTCFSHCLSWSMRSVSHWRTNVFCFVCFVLFEKSW